MPDRSGLRPELLAHLEAREREAAANPPPPLTPPQNRARAERDFPARWGEVEPIAACEDIAVPNATGVVNVRVYRPEAADGTILFLHGGGWRVGSPRGFEGPTRMLANRARANIVSVDYRLAPEHPYPAAIDDCYTVLMWLQAEAERLGLDISRLVVAGESAGGNLAAVLARRAHVVKLPFAGQVLIYPVTDGRMQTGSYRDFAGGFMLEAAGMQECYAGYVPDGMEATHPEISPLLAADFSMLPPAFLATCAFDPLRDEGRAYAVKLVDAGVATSFREYPGALHGIWLMKSITPLAEEIVSDAAAWVRELWARETIRP